MADVWWALGELADVVGHGVKLVHGVGRHFDALQILAVHVEQRIIHLIAGGSRQFISRPCTGRSRPNRNRYRPDSIHTAAAEQRNLLIGSSGGGGAQRQGVFLVFQQCNALTGDLLGGRLAGLVDLLPALE